MLILIELLLFVLQVEVLMDIREGIVWVVVTCEDQSKMTLQTTLNKDILKQYGASLEEGKLFDINRVCQVVIPPNANDISWYNDKPHYDSEVQRFAARFI